MRYISTWDDCRIRIANEDEKFIPNNDKYEVLYEDDIALLFVYKYETGAVEFYLQPKTDDESLIAGYEGKYFDLMWNYIEVEDLTKCETDPDDIWTLWKAK